MERLTAFSPFALQAEHPQNVRYSSDDQDFSSTASRAQRYGARGRQLGQATSRVAGRLVLAGVGASLFSTDLDALSGIIRMQDGHCAVQPDVDLDPIDIACPASKISTGLDKGFHTAAMGVTAASAVAMYAAPAVGERIGRAVGHVTEAVGYMAQGVANLPARLRAARGAVAQPDLEQGLTDPMDETTSLMAVGASQPVAPRHYGSLAMQALVDLPSPPTHLPGVERVGAESISTRPADQKPQLVPA